MPKDVPEPFIFECKATGAEVRLIDEIISDCGREARKDSEKYGWFDLSTLKEPYRLEGKKTMGFELAEQFEWNLPDVIIYPTDGGTGLRVPSVVGDFLMLRVLRESNGTAIAVDDEAILLAQRKISYLEGIFACPEGGAIFAGLEELRKTGWVKPYEKIVLFNTATGLKYPMDY